MPGKIWWSIDAAFSKIVKWPLFISMICAGFMMIVSTIDVITTKFFNLPIPGTHEYVEDLNILLVFLPLAYVQLERGHISGPVFDRYFSEAVNKAILITGQVMGAVICGFITWQAIWLTQEQIVLDMRKVGSIDYVLWPFGMATLIGFALATLAFILSLIRTIVKKEIASQKETPGF